MSGDGATAEPVGTPVLRKAHRVVNIESGRYAFTDLRKTQLGDVQNRQFRLFTPVKRTRKRLPTSLSEFHELRHVANLSDSPLTTAQQLGGHWSEHNLAAITQVAACNFRCSYCYVDYKHLSGEDSFTATASDVVAEFSKLQQDVNRTGRRLSILRVSGGEPLLAPSLVSEVYHEMRRQGLLDHSILKIESNLSTLSYTLNTSPEALSDLDADMLNNVKLHSTIHFPPGSKDWPAIREGLRLATSLGFDVFPAVGANDWSTEQLEALFRELATIAETLPLRLAVRPFDLSYPALANRRKKPDPLSPRAPSEIWEDILQNNLQMRYLEIPRHQVHVSGESGTRPNAR